MKPKKTTKKPKTTSKKGKNLQKFRKKPQEKLEIVDIDADLTPKRLKFCHEYIVDCNGKQAAIRTGYSERSAEGQASRLLRIDKVKAKIDELQAEIAKKNEISAEYVLKGIKEMTERCMAEIKPIMIRQGKGWVESGEYKFDSKGAAAGFKMLGEYKGLFKKVHTNDPDNPFLTGVVNIINIPSNGRELKDS